MTFYSISSFLFIITGLKETDSDSTGDGEDENEIRVLERVAEAGDVVSGECSTVASLEEAAGMMGGDVRTIFISQGGY